MNIPRLLYRNIQEIVLPLLLGLLTLCNAATAAELQPDLEITDLYLDPKERIPDINVAAEGLILAFANSGRLFRRSEDGGKTWARETIPERPRAQRK